MEQPQERSCNHKRGTNTRGQLAVVLLLLGLVAACELTDASIARLIRSQAQGGEQGSGADGGHQATPSDQLQESKPETTASGGGQVERLYPDLPRHPAGFVPPFGGLAANQQYHPQGPTPFVPFGLQAPPGGLRPTADQQPAANPFGRLLPVPRPTTPAERLQSKSFADGLGRRLLAMIGLNVTSNDQSATATADRRQDSLGPAQEMLQNATVLQQLSKGVNSIYGGLSRMYNSTIQEQINMLQERYKIVAANGTNSWNQRMADQVPQFFKQMATRLGEAQDQLNRVWRDVSTTNGSASRTMAAAPPPVHPSSWFNVNQPGAFLDTQLGGPEGFFGHQIGQMRDFWQAQVVPQIQTVRQQLGRVWQDLAASGALAPAGSLMQRSRQFVNNLQGTANGSSSSVLVDNLLKEIDSINGPEYSLIEPKNDDADSAATSEASPAASLNDLKPTNGTQNTDHQRPKLSLQMQNGLVNVQRELNKAWLGLTNSIQNALVNVGQSLEARPRFGSINQKASMGSAETNSEIDGKIRDLSKLQRDADLVNEAIQQQQYETQQRQQLFAGMDRFKSFFNQNFDLSQVEELPNRIGESLSRFGTVVGDLWNQMPERWDSFVSNMKPTTQAPN